MKEKTKQWIIVNLCYYIPYIVLAWLIREVFAPNTSNLKVLLFLLGIRAIYGLLDLLGGVLAWHLTLKKVAVNKMLEVFQTNKFPQRKYSSDSADKYIYRLAEPDSSNEYSKIIIDKAKELELERYRSSQLGLLAEARFNKVIEIAVDKYAPSSRATN